MSDWYRKTSTEVLQALQTDSDRGLSQEEVERRRQQYGANEIVEGDSRSVWQMLWDQVSDPLVVLLLIAGIVSAFLQDYKNAIAIFAIVVVNAIIGARQEYSAEKAMEALKRLAMPSVRVRRQGSVQTIPSSDLVPGDIVLLEAGNAVPADGRWIESATLRVQESSLTGESESVDKNAEVVFDAEQSLGDRSNVAFMGTTATYGRGVLAVTETGMKTELGNIAGMIRDVEAEETPLQKRLAALGKVLGGAAVAIAGVIFVLGILRGEDFKFMFLTAVSLMVAAVPEGLPAVVTIALALGARRMLARNALIRKLPAVETLGSVTVICSDKTGTLTQNRMTVVELEVAGDRIDLQDAWQDNGKKPAALLCLASGALCNDSSLEADGKAIGDPTEASLVVAAARSGLDKNVLERSLPRIAEAPFDSDRKRMTTLHAVELDASAVELDAADELPEVLVKSLLGAKQAAFCKGAIDSILEISTQVWSDRGPQPFDKAARDRAIAQHDLMAGQGLRVLAIAFRTWQEPPVDTEPTTLERETTFLGLVGAIDPPRPEVREAVQTCLQAGIRPVMITGDHPLTARHIAEELGIARSRACLTGKELSPMPQAELERNVEHTDVYARVSPANKLDIVRALQDRGQIVAMTGDGINDAPALKKADIGVAMGITGTDVAKEAAKMVLQDDNFATIVAAVEEGRVIYDNIRKFIKYVIAGNVGELWVILLAPFFGIPLPLQPIQILWINLIADGLLALSLSVEPAERNAMQRPPYSPGENVFARGVGRDIFWVGLALGLVLFAVAKFYYNAESDEVLMRSMVFSILGFSRIGMALAMRSQTEPLWRVGLLTNKPLLGVVVLTFTMQMAILYVPFIGRVFETVGLSPSNLGICWGCALGVFLLVEVMKRLNRSNPT